MDNVPFVNIGHGAQFRAFDMHNGRVLKLPLTEAETQFVACRRRNIIHGTLEEIASLEVRVHTFMNSKARIPAMINHGFKDRKSFLKLLGSPALEDSSMLPEDTPFKKWGPARVIYTQDKVEITRNLLEYLSEQENVSVADRRRFEQLIQQYIEHVYALWAYGYSDYVFKLGDMGIDHKGHIVTVDLGEFTSDLSFMERAVSEKWWYDNTNHQKKDFPKMPPELEKIYIGLIDSALTVAELRKRWRTNHICTECSGEVNTIAAFVNTQIAELDYIDRL